VDGDIFLNRLLNRSFPRFTQALGRQKFLEIFDSLCCANVENTSFFIFFENILRPFNILILPCIY